MARLLLLVACALVWWPSAAAGQCFNGQCPTPMWRAAPRQSAPQQVVTAPEPRPAKSHPAVVRIINQVSNSGMMPTGTGTVVDRDGQNAIVLSCSHLFDAGHGLPVVTFADDKTVVGHIIEVDPHNELSAILIPDRGVEPIQIDAQAPQPGEDVYSCGYGSDVFAVNRGRVTGYAVRGNGQQEVLQISGRARSGDSGGPIFNSRGAICGVLFGSNKGPNGGVDGTHCGVIQRFLSRHRLRRGAVAAGQPSATSQAATNAQPESPLAPTADPAPSQMPAEWAERIRDLEHEHAKLVSDAKPIFGEFTARLTALEQKDCRCECDPSQYVSRQEFTALEEFSRENGKLFQEHVRLHAEIIAPKAGVDESRTSPQQNSSSGWSGWVGDLFNAAAFKALLAIGVPGGLAGVGVWLLTRVAKRRFAAWRQTDQQQTQQATSSAAPIILHSQSPPPPQVVERNREFVPIETPSKRLTAIEKAMDEYVRRNPGARATIETIEAYADQFQSGDKP